jgi:cell pole-organizing protein PopZ
MPMPSPAANQTVEEILASIRQAIADDEVRRGTTPGALTTHQPTAPVRRVADESRAMRSANDDARTVERGISHIDDAETLNVVELAIEKAIDGVRAELDDNGDVDWRAPAWPPQPTVNGRAERRTEPRAPTPQPSQAAPPPGRQPLLSARSGAAVASAFGDLHRTVSGLTSGQIEAMAGEMLKPMLKAWLDDNLPGLVERLVREEIERVSRGRQ